MQYLSVLRPPFLALLLQSFLATGASAVSVGEGCNYPSIQAAVAAAAGNFVEIHVLQSYVSPPIQITGKVVYILGGYANCDDATALPGAYSTISAVGYPGSAIEVQSGAVNNTILKLNNLVVTGANTVGNGGGISFKGHGELDLTHVTVGANRAENGGGIDVFPDGPYLGTTDPTGYSPVELRAGSRIANNDAHHDGAGIRLQGGSRLLVVESDVAIYNNRAGVDENGNDDPDVSDDDGGGVQVVGPARADIGSSGNDGNAVIHNNQATKGGGISIRGGMFAGAGGGVVRLFTKDISQVTRIDGNAARQVGGGIYVAAVTVGHTGTRVCGFGYGINDNVAADGAAIYSGVGETGATLARSDLDSANCGPESASAKWGAASSLSSPNTVSRNVATDPGGAVISIQDLGVFQGDQIQLQYNHGANLFNVLFADATNLRLNSCLITNNVVTGDLIVFISELTHLGGLQIDGCTLAKNSLGSSNWVVAPHSATTTLQRSILWQPGNESVYVGSSSDIVTDVIASEIATLSRGTSSGLLLVNDDPAFVDLVNDNYHLQASSPAVDYTAVNLSMTDLEGNPRPVALVHTATPYDIGAFELQSLPPSGCSASDGIYCNGFESR